jgi:hypothetical protein
MSKKQTTREIRQQTVTNIQDRLLKSVHGEFYVTTDFVQLGDAISRSGARRALKFIEALGPYGCREVHPGHWQVQRDVDALTCADVDTALTDHSNTLGVLTRNLSGQVAVQLSDVARLEALTQSITDLHGVFEVRGGWDRVYLDDNTKTLVPELPKVGTIISKLSGLVTWDDGVPTGTSPEAEAYVQELRSFCSAHRNEV